MKHYDIVIVGAGPAGSTLARILEKKYKVLLIDSRELDKAPSKAIKNCGGLIAPDAQKVLASFNLAIPKSVLVTPQMFSVKTIDFDNNLMQNYQRHYINVDRELFDRWLVSLTNCERAFGFRFKSATKENGVHRLILTKNGKQRVVCCNILIGADGANSRVKKLLPISKEPKRYISIQEWFKNTQKLNEYVAIFDSEISNFYSWIIPKEDIIIFGTAIEEGKNAIFYHNLQKQKLNDMGYELNKPLKKEGCFLLRPMGSRDIYLGKDKIALVGEASGFISPTSAEGISYAMLSANSLAEALIEDKKNFLKLYNRKTKFLKRNINLKMLKYPAMYNKLIRKTVIGSNIGAIKMSKDKPLVTGCISFSV